MRRHRTWIAALLLLTVTFSQIVTAAYACPLLDPVGSGVAKEAAAEAMPADCPTMAQKGQTAPNICQSHCYAVPQVDAQAIAPVVLLATVVGLVIRFSEPVRSISAAASGLRPVTAAPPPRLRFARFLI